MTRTGDGDGPRFSVCLCTYNDGETIDACLDSILNQLDDRYELVVTDGGSDDGTRDALNDRVESADIDVRIFTQPEPGLGVARQVCVNEARGDYLLEQVDADMVFADCFDELLDFYLQEVDNEDPFQLLARGIRVTPRTLHEWHGGWRPFPHGFQENELTRRLFSADALRLLDLRVARHLDPEFEFETALRRYLYNYREKLRCGISVRYAYKHLYTSDLPLWRKILDSLTIPLTYAWGLRKERYDTFDGRDPLAFGIDAELYAGIEAGRYKDIRLTPPADLVDACFEEAEDKTYSYTG
jgi:glycosyltransferase involved in cell wall biosynthesis